MLDDRTARQLTVSLARKVRRRDCPRCRKSLEEAIVTVHLQAEHAQLGFVCCGCGFQSEGLVPLSDRIKRELLRGRAPEPVTDAEVTAVKRILASWNQPLTELFA